MREFSSYDEASIIFQVSEGDEPAFRILFDHYRDKIYSIAHKLVKEDSAAEDVVQEVFIKLWLQKEKLPELINLAGYIHTLTRNFIFSQLRKLATEEAYLRELINTQQTQGRTSADEVVYSDLKKLLSSAVAQLPPQQKKVYQLGKIEGKKYEEIGSLLNISRETVKDHMMKASNSVRVYLKKNEGLLALLILLIHSG